jgi:hypothetical protein
MCPYVCSAFALSDRASILAGVYVKYRTIVIMFVTAYGLASIASLITQHSGFTWWRTVIAYAISMTMGVAAPRLFEPQAFKHALTTAPQLKKSSGRVSLVMIALMAVSIGFQYLFPNFSDTQRDWLILGLNGFAFLFRLGLTLATRPQPIECRVRLTIIMSCHVIISDAS